MTTTVHRRRRSSSRESGVAVAGAGRRHRARRQGAKGTAAARLDDGGALRRRGGAWRRRQGTVTTMTAVWVAQASADNIQHWGSLLIGMCVTELMQMGPNKKTRTPSLSDCTADCFPPYQRQLQSVAALWLAMSSMPCLRLATSSRSFSTCTPRACAPLSGCPPAFSACAARAATGLCR